MADPQTANLQLFIPVNGADPGTWDVPANANSNQLEAVLTATPSVALSNLPVTLSAAQYNSALITFTGTLSAVVTVTFPVFARTWTLFNNCLGDPRSLTVVCKTSNSTVFVALPPGEPIRVVSDGTNIRYMDLGRVGSYLDMASSAIPAWISNATPQPYLLCNGTTFSSATYPALRDYLGSVTLPDAQGRYRAMLNLGTGRLQNNSGTLGVDGNTFLNGGGTISISSQNLPNTGFPVTDPKHFHSIGNTGPPPLSLGGANNVAAGADIAIQSTVLNTDTAATNITVASGGTGAFYSPPGYVGGLTLIRAG